MHHIHAANTNFTSINTAPSFLQRQEVPASWTGMLSVSGCLGSGQHMAVVAHSAAAVRMVAQGLDLGDEGAALLRCAAEP